MTTRALGAVLRRGIAAGLVTAMMAISTGSVAHAEPATGDRATPGPSMTEVAVEVEVAPTIAEAAELRSWVDEEVHRTLAALPPEPARRGSLRIAIAGALYDYAVTLTIARDGEVIGAPLEWSCECSNGELLARLREALPEVTRGLEVVQAPQRRPRSGLERATFEPDWGAMEQRDDQRRRGRLGAVGSTGVALTVLGASGVATGAAFMVLDLRPPTDAWVERRVYEPRGVATVGASTGVLLTGIVLLLLRRRTPARRSVARATMAPESAARGDFAMVVKGRF